MTDRELLEAAAKAAQFDLCWFEVGTDDPDCLPGWYCTNVTNGGMWNPLTDDGDALRLAVKCGMTLNVDIEMQATGVVGAWLNDKPCPAMAVESFDNDPYAATRRAIVRAAAERDFARAVLAAQAGKETT